MAVELDEIRQTAERLQIEAQAKNRFTATDPDAAASHTLYRQNMHLYDPANGDQWPDDGEERPDKVHLTFNIIKPAVDIASRIQSILPRLSLTPSDPRNPDSRSLAETIERMHYDWLAASEWDLWMNDACRTKAIAGRTFLKPFWNEEESRPDVAVIEQPHRLRIGWRGNDYKKMDWALFEYSLSPMEAKIRWPHIAIHPNKSKGPLVVEVSDHTDPLDTIPNTGFVGLSPGGGQNEAGTPVDRDYEQQMVQVWDYWYKKIDKGTGKVQICNAMLVEGVLVDGPNVHNEYIDIPFILIENDHRPGSPLGISDVKSIADIQDALNRLFSSYTQLVNDNSDPSWQKVGENATDVEPGDVPKANEVVAPGPGNRLERIDTGVNTFPVDQLLSAVWDAFHKVTGLTEALFGGIPGSQTSGRALAVQIEGAANRLSPRRDRLYASIRRLFVFWKAMLIANNATIELPAEQDEETGEMGEPENVKLKPMLESVGPWKIVAPEITPRDVTEHIMNNINMIQSKMRSLKHAMDDTGVESPEDEIRDIIEERNNADLFPADVQTKVAVMQLLQSIGMQQQQQEQMSAMAEAQSASNQQTTEQMGANPALPQEAGGEMAGLPMAQQGAAGGTPLSSQTLLRGDQETGQVDNLQQIAIRP